MYGNFKSVGRAARRGHLAIYTTSYGHNFTLRPVKSDKVGRSNGQQNTRHWKGAQWADETLRPFAGIKPGQKLTRL